MLTLALAVLASVLNPGAQNRAPTVAVCGDSTARDWPTLLIGQGHYEMSNKFASGAVVATCVAQWKYNARPYEVDAVVMACGINDLKNASNSTPQAVFDQLVVALDQALADGVEVWIVSVLPTQYRGVNGPTPPLQPGEVEALNALLEDYADTRPGAYFVDVYPLFLNSGGGINPDLYDVEWESRDSNLDGVNELWSVYLHPSALGDQVIADALLTAWGW
jgi:lysophospholipase L1-like esterase